MSRDTEWATGWTTEELQFDSRQIKGIFSSPEPRSSLGTGPASYSMNNEGRDFSGEKAAEASSSYSSKVKNEWT
jgi:hypothetical protein